MKIFPSDMRTYVSKWPDGSISVLTAESEVELFDKLDSEGDPNICKIFLMPTQFHLTSEVKNNKIEISEEDEAREFRFSRDILERVYF